MTSKPASRSARATIVAPRSCPSRPGFATTTRILRSLIRCPRRGAPPPLLDYRRGAVSCRISQLLGDQHADALAVFHDLVPDAGDGLPVEPLAVVVPAGDEVQVEVRHRLERGGAVGLQQ